MPRVFIAIRVGPTRPLGRLLDQLGQLGRAVKPVPPQNLHLTVRFLGQIDNLLLQPVSRAIRTAVASAGVFDLTLTGLTAWPNIQRPRTVCVGTEPHETLLKVHERLTTELADLGFAPEPRPWAAHVTAARVKARPPQGLADLVAAHPQAPFGVTTVRSVDLMLSELLPTRPRYTVADACTLD